MAAVTLRITCDQPGASAAHHPFYKLANMGVMLLSWLCHRRFRLVMVAFEGTKGGMYCYRF